MRPASWPALLAATLASAVLLPGVVALGVVALGVAPTGARAQAAGAAEPAFEIHRFDVDGNTVLPPTAIEAALAPHTGARRTFADVRAAVDALQRAYARRGFGAVQVSLPEQRVADGVVRIAVVEPPLRSVTLEGNHAFDDTSIRRSLPALRRGATPDTGALAAQIRLANENPARRLSVDLQRGRQRRHRGDRAGAGPEALEGGRRARQHRHAGNRAPPRRLLLPARECRRPQPGLHRPVHHLARASGQVTIVAANHRVPLPSLGDSVDLYGVLRRRRLRRRQRAVQRARPRQGGGIRYQQNLPPSAAYRHRLSYGLE